MSIQQLPLCERKIGAKDLYPCIGFNIRHNRWRHLLLFIPSIKHSLQYGRRIARFFLSYYFVFPFFACIQFQDEFAFVLGRTCWRILCQRHQSQWQ